MTDYQPQSCWCGDTASHIVPVDQSVTRPTGATRDDQPGLHVCELHAMGRDGAEPIDRPVCTLCGQPIVPGDDARRIPSRWGVSYVHAHHPGGVSRRQPGVGCGVGSDGHPCSPAYLCPACIAVVRGL